MNCEFSFDCFCDTMYICKAAFILNLFVRSQSTFDIKRDGGGGVTTF